MDALFPTEQPPIFSFWEIDRYLSNIDLLIVGSGIVGLTSAIYCKTLSPSMNIVVMERGCLPSGASTKNAGFACFGSAGELLADLRTQSEDVVFTRIQRRLKGIAMLREMLGDAAIGYENCGGFELFTQKDEAEFDACLRFIVKANDALRAVTGIQDTFAQADDRIQDFGLSGISHLIENRGEGAIHTGRMMEALLVKANNMGVKVMNGLGVKSLVERTDGASVILENGHELRVGHVHVATNGFAAELLPHLDVKPARAQVLITSPIDNLRINGTFHLDEGYCYFRNVGDRLLLGGGRNLDIAGETSTEIGLTPNIQHYLNNLLRTIILPENDCTIAHRWSGVMGVGNTKDTLVHGVSPHVTCAVRMGGMGIALGTLIGNESAAMILGKETL